MSKIFIKLQNTNSNFKSAHVVIIKDGNVLIMKRSSTDPWMPGHYGLPGGKLNSGENTIEAACRECKEEASIEVFPKDLIFLPEVSKDKRHAFY